jgi:hypothetical protein
MAALQPEAPHPIDRRTTMPIKTSIKAGGLVMTGADGR